MLSAQHIRLRAPEPQDEEIMLAWENDQEHWKVSNTLIPFSRKVLREYLNGDHDLQRDRQFRYVVELLDGPPVGMVDIFEYDPVNRRCGLGILIDNDSRGKGYAKESLGVCIDYCFNHLNLMQVHASVLADNQSSLRLFRNLDFEECGRRKNWVMQHGFWVDEILFQKLAE